MVQTNTVASLAASADTYIDDGDSGINYGDSTSLVIDHSGGDIGNVRALLQFDLGSIPAGATITGATLQLEATSNTGAFDINVYEVTEAWVEGSGNGTADAASWDARQPFVAWSTPGGTYDPTIIATLNTSLIGQHSWDITSLVTAWYGGSTVNNGIIIGSPDGGGDVVTYDSSEGATPPTLVITYTGGNSAPTGSVTIDNTTPAQGDTLTAANTLADADGLSGAISYQWQRDGAISAVRPAPATPPPRPMSVLPSAWWPVTPMTSVRRRAWPVRRPLWSPMSTICRPVYL